LSQRLYDLQTSAPETLVSAPTSKGLDFEVLSATKLATNQGSSIRGRKGTQQEEELTGNSNDRLHDEVQSIFNRMQSNHNNIEAIRSNP
jgi:hypothetical protein